jgi:sulfide:quinone oxidoreductase
LEATLALRRLAEERVELELLAPDPYYWYRPLAVAEPFQIGLLQRVEVTEIAAAAGAAFTLGELASVDSERGCVWSSAGARFDYDALLLACGARAEPVLDGALTFRGPADVEAFRGLLGRLESGEIERLVFAVPAGVVWQLPLYELALLTAAYLEGRRVVDVELVFVTPEEEPLALFGSRASEAVEALLAERGIVFCRRTYPVAFEGQRLVAAVGEDIDADEVVSLPRLRGVAIEGIAHDPDGFVKVDRHGRVLGANAIYAAGDITSFPIKQGGLAAQQAIAAAETIAAAAGAPVTPTPFQPILRGMLLTGAIPRYLRAAPAGTAEPEVSVDPLWWPPTKIAARHLSPYLAGRTLKPSQDHAPIPVELDFDKPAADSAPPTDARNVSTAQTAPDTTDERPHDPET